MIVIVDIDNTLALNDTRFELATKEDGKVNWDIAYNFDLVLADRPNYPMIKLVQNYINDGVEIIIFTGRPEAVRIPTELWLDTYGVPYDKLYMRTPQDHYIPANKLKKRMYDKYITDSVFCAYDDEQSIIDLWTSLGIPTFKVNGI